MGQLFLLLLIAICWGLPTLWIKSYFDYMQNNPESPSQEAARVLLWVVGVGYPLGLILFIIFIKSLPD